MFNKHPIQLTSLQVTDLKIEVHDMHAIENHEAYEQDSFALTVGVTEFNKETSAIHVRLKFTTGKYALENSEDKKTEPLSVKVSVVGRFLVDLNKFSIAHVDSWAQKNAPLILYPYVREQVYGLCTRVGVKQMILPLLEVPTIINK